MAAGWTIVECLADYPDYAAQLRPLLEAVGQVPLMRASRSELLEDREIVWQRLMESDPFVLPPPTSRNRRGYRVFWQLIAAVLVFVLLVGATWFVLTRLVLPPEVPILETLTPTATLSATPTVTSTLMPTSTYTVTATVTSTVTPTLTLTNIVAATATGTHTATLSTTPTFTLTATSSVTPTVILTNASGCGQPLTAQAAVDKVMSIYPNTTITSVRQTTKFGGTLVWEVTTSHGLTINIDVACGIILSIEQPGGNTTSTTNTPQPGGGITNGNNNDNTSPPASNNNENENENENDNESGSSGMGS